MRDIVWLTNTNRLLPATHNSFGEIAAQVESGMIYALTTGARVSGAISRFFYRDTRRLSLQVSSTPNPLPATFFRGGTSKGIFINRAHLPVDRAEWARIFLGIMGSPDAEHQMQLNGMGGGRSSLSKVCVVGVPSDADAARGIDIEYTFAQVGIADGTVDYAGNCGNLTSVVGVFALDERICKPKTAGSHATVRALNTNTGKLIDTTFPVAPVTDTDAVTPILDLAEADVAGVPGMASKIILDFISPGGARTGKLLPSGSPIDIINIQADHGRDTIHVSLVDATNPTVFITSSELRTLLAVSPDSPISFSDSHVLARLESIRQHSAQRMDLDPSMQSQPKIAVLSSPCQEKGARGADIYAHSLSMGVLHRAVPMTVGLCLGVAAGMEGTLAWKIVKRSRETQGETPGGLVRIAHPSGMVDVGAEFGLGGEVVSAKVVRTGRRLMKGVVWW